MYAPSLEAAQAWLLLHSEWLGPTIAFMALIESLVVVGLLVPGVPIMFALGVMAGSGAMEPGYMLLWGFVGAVIGDGISYQLGHRYHNKVRSWWPFNKHPDWLEKGEVFFHKHGDLSIALGRFIGPVRPVVPVVAGMLNMPPKRFYLVNFLSAIPWSPVYLMPGFLAGAAIQTHGQLPMDFFSLIASLLMFSVVLPVAGLWLVKKYYPANVFGGATIILLTILLVLIASIVLDNSSGLAQWNVEVEMWLEKLRVPYLHETMSWLTWLGSLPVLCVPVLLWSGWNWYQSRRELVVIWAVAFTGMEVSYWGLKWLINYPRPSLAMTIDPYSFPSGHTTQAVFVLVGLSLFISRQLTYISRVLIISTCAMLALLVGLSRLVLDVHWVSDVLAGTVLGGFWLFLGLFVSARQQANGQDDT